MTMADRVVVMNAARIAQVGRLMNNAAIFTAAPLVETNRAAAAAVFAINVNATVRSAGVTYGHVERASDLTGMAVFLANR